MAKLRELFGKRLEELLKMHHVKQCELASKLDIDPQSISRMISGKHFPKEENLEKMAEALDVLPESLFKFSHNLNKQDLIYDINKLLKNSSEKNYV